ncbi:ABC transporter ATP-binding protein [Periweissella ghanensis]|uniref:Vitamin B12 import ATP-binding protein BtuD n=1 Tax=Periweissella ghanensis TaxID=467997 RepID=A0ABM8ZAR0_9LACO|nr:ABC transporter ATP-binding protein [Periweissella ghanensis]MCM0601105.1 ABC transporter ATP-binding protein [Periweissella ghanensis]CAH0417812.1 Vitamin B12 import ATP-binding protein BtuD [Periweissella ghanensis]
MAVIELQHVTKKYATLVANKDISITIQPGELVGLIGENGAGKSTLIKQLLGLEHVTSGQINIFDSQLGTPKLRQLVGVMQQTDMVIRNVKVNDILQWAHALYQHPLAVNEVLKITDLAAQKNQYITELSGGQLRRLSFGLAIIGQPQLLLLDEPTVGMDVLNRKRFWDYVRQLQQAGTTIIVTSHYLDEIADTVNRLLILKHGQLTFDGTLIELQQQINKTVIDFESAQQLGTAFNTDQNILNWYQLGNHYKVEVTNSDEWLQTYAEQLPAFTGLQIKATSLTEIMTNMLEEK